MGMTDAAALRERYVARLRAEGAITRDDVAAAFATVPREAFLRHGFHDSDRATDGTAGGFVTPDDPGFLEGAYRNDALVTKLADGIPVSSSSQPSLMAAMIEALDLARGARVLEIGAGTGYNAALMAAVGAEVTTVDAQPDVAQRAAAALAGTPRTRVVTGDGYAGAPDGAPYDRVIVTVGVSGASPAWLDQLAPGGFVLAPIRHAGHHPVMRVDRDRRLRAFCGAGFMAASGPLSARYPGAHPDPWHPAAPPDDTVSVPARWSPPLSHPRYSDLWFAVGVWDRRATFGAFGHGDGVLRDPDGDGGAVVGRDGAVRAGGPHAAGLAADAVALLDRWTAAGAPALPQWAATMALSGEADRPIWVPREWVLEPVPDPVR
jgi:protein-L-isoaspartate(D-aspartate) O-methyltransferase